MQQGDAWATGYREGWVQEPATYAFMPFIQPQFNNNQEAYLPEQRLIFSSASARYLLLLVGPRTL